MKKNLFVMVVLFVMVSIAFGQAAPDSTAQVATRTWYNNCSAPCRDAVIGRVDTTQHLLVVTIHTWSQAEVDLLSRSCTFSVKGQTTAGRWFHLESQQALNVESFDSACVVLTFYFVGFPEIGGGRLTNAEVYNPQDLCSAN